MRKVLLLALASALAASVASAERYGSLVRGLEDWMDGGMSVKRADTSGFVAVGNNGNRFRLDLDGHGDRPHGHLEVQNPNGKYMDAPGTDHRLYLKDD